MQLVNLNKIAKLRDNYPTPWPVKEIEPGVFEMNLSAHHTLVCTGLEALEYLQELGNLANALEVKRQPEKIDNDVVPTPR